MNILALNAVFAGNEFPPMENPMNAAMIRAAVREELTHHDRWLIVFDNLGHVDLMDKQFQFQLGHQHVLFTAQYQYSFKRLNAARILLGDMDDEEARKLFWVKFSEGSEDEDLVPLVAELVSVLNYLPLAIVQAADYLSETGAQFRSYIDRYNDLLTWTPTEGDLSYQTVAKVMTISFDKVRESENSVRFFCLLSYFQANNIPDVWTPDEKFQDCALGEMFRDPEQINRALQHLRAYGFVNRSRKTETLSIHGLVQEVMRGVIEGRLPDKGGVLEKIPAHHRTPMYWVERAIEIVTIAYPCSDPKSYANRPKGRPDEWATCVKYNPHAKVLIKHGREKKITTDCFARLLFGVGEYENDHGYCKSARDLFQLSLDLFEKKFGEDHVDTGGTIVAIAGTYRGEGNFSVALEYLKRALRIFENHYGVDSFETAGTIGNIGMWFIEDGNPRAAIEQIERAKKIFEKDPNDDINIAHVNYALGQAYAISLSRPNVTQAVKLFKTSLDISEKVYEPEHIKTVPYITSLGQAYCARGDFDKATEFSMRALDMLEKAFGKGSVPTSGELCNLGWIYGCQENYDKALKLFEYALEICEKEFGRGHLFTARPIMCIGLAYRMTRNLSLARQYFIRGYAIFVKAHGEGSKEAQQARNCISGTEGLRRILFEIVRIWARFGVAIVFIMIGLVTTYLYPSIKDYVYSMISTRHA